MTQSWNVHHFSLSNPKGNAQGDVVALLHRLADAVEGLGDAEIQDITFCSEVSDDGSWPRMTVYFHHRGEAQDLPRATGSGKASLAD